MRRSRQPTGEDLLRLDGIAKRLGLSSRWPGPGFQDQVIDVTLDLVADLLGDELPESGEAIAARLAEAFSVRFMEVYGSEDIDRIEEEYLREKRELGFALLREELSDSATDALLFRRVRAERDDTDQFVAVLNLQRSNSRGYFNRFHELTHRIVEPAQQSLPFRRHQMNGNPLESLIDMVGGELAFYPPVFRPLVESDARDSALSFGTVSKIRDTFAPSASFLSVMNAVVRHWPTPAIAFTATVRGRLSSPNKDIGLRVCPQARNAHARRVGLLIFNNMRVPSTSPAFAAFMDNRATEGPESVANWSTSTGGSPSALNVYTAASRLGDHAYGLMSIPD